MQTVFPSAMPADNLHGDESQGEPLSIEEETFLVHRTDELLAERLADRAMFHDLMSGIDALEIEPHLHRALMNLDAACRGNRFAIDGITASLAIIQRRLRIESRIVWAEECREEAERQAKEEFA